MELEQAEALLGKPLNVFSDKANLLTLADWANETGYQYFKNGNWLLAAKWYGISSNCLAEHNRIKMLNQYPNLRTDFDLFAPAREAYLKLKHQKQPANDTSYPKRLSWDMTEEIPDLNRIPDISKVSF